MRISRVSNAGVLLELDGVKILLDGFCTGHGPYLATPAHIRESLMTNPPDMLAFTHEHPDHFDALAAEYYHKQLSQFSSVAQSCLTLCNPMDCSTPGLPVHHQLPKFTQTHVH